MNRCTVNLLKSIGIFVALILLYLIFDKFFATLDAEFSWFLNKFFLKSKSTRFLFAGLTHYHESWINVIVMLSLNFWAVFRFKPNNLNLTYDAYKAQAIFLSVYCWLSFQVILLLNSLIFGRWLEISRASPSVVLEGLIRLSQIFNNAQIKDYSYNSFPAGHALIVIYWILFTNIYADQLIKLISWLLGILLVLPRMVTGAHWLSDTVFSLLLGWVYFNLNMWLINHYAEIKKRIY